MARKARIDCMSNYSHIIVQGIDKSYIFKETYFKKLYLNLMEKNLEELEIEILAYCVMDNHTHILLYSENTDEVMTYMRKVNTAFAIIYNRMNNRVGYVFRDRYYLQPIISERQLYNCLVYIHNNPIKAMMVADYKDYVYSSYNEFCNRTRLITNRAIQLIFGTTNNYLRTFDKIHKDRIVEDIKDVSEFIDEKIVINDYLKLVNKELDEVLKDKILLKELLIILKKKSGISFRRMSELFKINRETLRMICQK